MKRPPLGHMQTTQTMANLGAMTPGYGAGLATSMSTPAVGMGANQPNHFGNHQQAQQPYGQHAMNPMSYQNFMGAPYGMQMAAGQGFPQMYGAQNPMMMGMYNPMMGGMNMNMGMGMGQMGMGYMGTGMGMGMQGEMQAMASNRRDQIDRWRSSVAR